jgi:hypothetical protein
MLKQAMDVSVLKVTAKMLARANIFLRTAERILLVIAAHG